jgi:regulator of PEP synthase PpsR (kinase-PPPase family)
MLTIFVISDATGKTAGRVVRSAPAQFGAAAVLLTRRVPVTTHEEVRAMVAELRRSRAQHLKMGSSSFVALEDIREELMRSQILCLDHGWRRVDVTGKSAEEVALEILALLEPGTRPEVAEETVAAPGDAAREHGQLGKGHRNEARPAGFA